MTTIVWPIRGLRRLFATSERSVSTFPATAHANLYSLNFLFALTYLYHVVFILILLLNMWTFKTIIKNKYIFWLLCCLHATSSTCRGEQLEGAFAPSLVIKKCWSQCVYNKQITSWLVCKSDFYSLVMNHNSWIKIVRAHQPWSNLYIFSVL